MSRLAYLQRRLQQVILHDASRTEGLVTSAGLTDGLDRVGIYVTAYHSRLEDALAANYPMLHVHLGPQLFARVARAYLESHPSCYVSIRSFGGKLPQWLLERRSSEPWLAELARLEWTLGCAFDAPDDAAAGIDSLSQIQAADWPALAFRFAASARRLSLATNAADLYRAAANADAAPAGQVLSSAREWLVWRTSLQPHYRSLEPAEAAAFDLLGSGGTFAELCELLAELAEDDASVPATAAALLKRWLLDELIVELVLQHE